MLEGKFPKGNITRVGHNTESGASSEKFTIGSTSYSIREVWVSSDFFINVPSCWAMSASLGGVTLSLKAMMPAVTEGELGDMHSYISSENTPALSILNNQPTFKNKFILSLIDAITMSPAGGTNVKEGYKVIASKDPLAADYHGIQALKEGGLAAKSETTALKVLELAAKDPYNLGINDPNNMEVVNIEAPFETHIVTPGNSKLTVPDIQLLYHSNQVTFTYPMSIINNSQLDIITLHGKRIWTGTSNTNAISWQYNDMKNARVSSGNYIYILRLPQALVRGVVSVQ